MVWNSFREMVWKQFYYGNCVETVLLRKLCGNSFIKMVWNSFREMVCKQFYYGNCVKTVLGRWCGNSFITEIVWKQFYKDGAETVL